MIYLAAPYTHDDPEVRRRRFEAANGAAAAIMQRTGKTVFSPISHGHPICQHGVPFDFAFWSDHVMPFLERAEELVVLKLEGWDRSAGVAAEIDAATELGLPISYLTTEN